MPSLAQIEANRRNAIKSTGPRSPEGKAVSRFNAFKTGIDAQSIVVPGEDPLALEELTAEYHERFRPTTPDRRFLVDSLVNAEWQLRRLRKIEAQLWMYAYDSIVNEDEVYWLGIAWHRSTDRMTRIQRRIDSTERVYRRALEKLERPEPPDSTRPAPARADESVGHALACPSPAPEQPCAPAPAGSQPIGPQSPKPMIGFVPPPAATRLVARHAEPPGSRRLPGGALCNSYSGTSV